MPRVRDRSFATMIGLGTIWALLGIPSFQEILVVAVVVLVLYGRSAALPGRHFRSLWPWLSPVRRTPGRPSVKPVERSRWGRGDRVFWFLTIMAATAVAAWIVTRTLILIAPGASH
jgi:hypothetical protein